MRILLTGGSRGLGLLTARDLGRRGARVTLAARDQGEHERARQMLAADGIDVSTRVADIADKEEAERLVESALAFDELPLRLGASDEAVVI